MKTLTLSLIAMLATIASAGAATITMDIENTDLGAVGHQGRTLVLYELELPDAVAAADLLGATLTLRVRTVQAEDGFLELEVAEWLDGAPVLPSRKERYVSEAVPASEASTLRLDLTPILCEALAAERDEVTLAIGDISGSALGSLTVLADAQTDVWGEIVLRIE
jgi:hypothetical protein